MTAMHDLLPSGTFSDVRNFIPFSLCALLLSVDALAQVVNRPISEPCSGHFDTTYQVQVVPGGRYVAKVHGRLVTTHSTGSGRGGGYKRGHSAISSSQMSMLTVRDANNQVIAVFTSGQMNDKTPQDPEGSFVSSTNSVSIEVVGTCRAWHGARGAHPALELGPATFTFSVNGPPLPRPRVGGEDSAEVAD